MNKINWNCVKLLITDVDGVMTDGSMYYGPDGEAVKRFSVKDGMGLVLLQNRGVRVAIVTAERTNIVSKRAEKLRIREVHQGVLNKGARVRDLAKKYELAPSEIAFIGDDVNDLPGFKEVGIPIAVRDAMPAVRQAALYVTSRPGGRGAVREVADLILAALDERDEPDAVTEPDE